MRGLAVQAGVGFVLTAPPGTTGTRDTRNLRAASGTRKAERSAANQRMSGVPPPGARAGYVRSPLIETRANRVKST
jgi:hypothetical protein